MVPWHGSSRLPRICFGLCRVFISYSLWSWLYRCYPFHFFWREQVWPSVPFFFMFFCPGCWYYSMTCSLLLCWLNSIISLYNITHNSTPHQIVKWRYICVHECTRLKASLFDERWLTGGLTRQGRDWTLLAPFPALNKQTTAEEKRRGWVGWRFKWFYSMLLYNSFLPLRYSSMAFLYKRRRCPRKQKRFHSLVCSLSCFLLTCLILHTISLLLPLLLFNYLHSNSTPPTPFTLISHFSSLHSLTLCLSTLTSLSLSLFFNYSCLFTIFTIPS